MSVYWPIPRAQNSKYYSSTLLDGLILVRESNVGDNQARVVCAVNEAIDPHVDSQVVTSAVRTETLEQLTDLGNFLGLLPAETVNVVIDTHNSVRAKVVSNLATIRVGEAGIHRVQNTTNII